MARPKTNYFNGEKIYNNIITAAFEGTPINTTEETFEAFPTITKDFCNSIECVHGADTSVTFQYSFVLEYTDYEAIWERKNKTRFTEDSKSEVVKLVANKFTVVRYTDNGVVLISPHYQKLEAISKLMDYAKDFFVFKYIGVTKFDGTEVIKSLNLNGCDIIKSAQNEFRHFEFKWVTDRANKYLN